MATKKPISLLDRKVFPENPGLQSLELKIRAVLLSGCREKWKECSSKWFQRREIQDHKIKLLPFTTTNAIMKLPEATRKG